MDIDKIILKALNKKASLEEYEALESWKQESQQNLDYLSTMLSAESDSHTPYQQFDEQEAWNKISPKISSTKSWNWQLAVAAILLLLLIGAVYSSKQEKIETYPKVHETKAVMAELQLKDASMIYLNAESNLTELSDFSNQRDVSLRGEAYFDITKDDSKPFTIQLNNNDLIKVVGTQFNVINTEEQFDLIIYSGTVELNTLNRVIELIKGDRVTKVDGAYVKYRNKDLNAVSWKTKELTFDNSPLNEVFDALANYYRLEIKLENSAVAEKCSLRTKFSNQSIESVMQELQKIYGLNYSISDSFVEIRDLKCN